MKRYRNYSLVAVLAVLAVVTTTAVLTANSHQTREIVIVAKDMKFTVVGDSDNRANPPLRFNSSTDVTIIFRNEDVGMRHDLVLEGLAVRSSVLAYGEQEVLTFTVPSGAGVFEYLCSLHPTTMRGLLTIFGGN
jgi:plastocyanin